jgi:hypothetical protein
LDVGPMTAAYTKAKKRLMLFDYDVGLFSGVIIHSGRKPMLIL